MIEVVTFVNGKRRDTAEADTPEAAIVAARVLIREANLVGDIPVQMARPIVRFYVDGVMVRETDRV